MSGATSRAKSFRGHCRGCTHTVAMRFGSLSMRVWLALVVAVIVSVAAVAVAEVLTVRSEAAFRSRAEDLAAGSAVTAASSVSDAANPRAAREALSSASSRRRIALFLFDDSGTRISNGSSNGIAAEWVVGLDDAVAEALAGRRLVVSSDGGRRIVVALPLRSGPGSALVAVASRPDLAAAGDIVRGQLWSLDSDHWGCGARNGCCVPDHLAGPAHDESRDGDRAGQLGQTSFSAVQ